ncbi:hypothetical protein QCA50_009986 [Cerrena zonata]|uniref:Uncharacterized protein n=1 Tax=Cerrena zonata TaxID=2478898 RepID=A0AAW0G5B9_9APHY
MERMNGAIESAWETNSQADKSVKTAATANIPPSTGFRTPFVNSSRWADVGRISATYNPENSKKKDPGELFSDTALFDNFLKKYDPYPDWGANEPVPIERREIEAIFIQLFEVFGFQYDNTRNMFDYFLKLLDSRASRMGPIQALRSLHADYIGGINSNFRKWYFAAQLDIDDANASTSETEKPKKKTIHSLEDAERQCVATITTMPLMLMAQFKMLLLAF